MFARCRSRGLLELLGGLFPGIITCFIFVFTSTQYRPQNLTDSCIYRQHVPVAPAIETKGTQASIKIELPFKILNTTQLAGPNSPNPMHKQQTRSSSTNQPRNQMEAMPPNQSPNNHSSTATFNPATVHPVFFAQAWRKAPFPLPGATGFSPVATGYVFGGTGVTRKEPSTKL